MDALRKLARPIAVALSISLTSLGIPTQVFAGIVGTDEAIQVETSNAARDQVKTLLARADVQKELVAAGVNPDEVNDRVNAMTDAEVVALSGKLDQAAAGGDALGIAALIFLVLIVTDLMGWTDIFPFTRKGSARR